jgi:hypothetical protein
LILACTVFISCRNGQHRVGGSDLITIDVLADYPKEEIRLQDIADVEYVPLAISKEVLLGHGDRLFYLSDKYIIVSNNYQSGEICVFNRNGEILSHFNRRGRGPNEYSNIRDIVFDNIAEEFFVSTVIPDSRILVYSLEGEYKRTLPLPKGWQIKANNFNEESLLVYDEGGVAHGKFSTTPYHLISKIDGSIIETLDIEMVERYSNSAVFQTQTIMLSGVNHRLGGKSITLADISYDTVYHYTRKRVLTPIFVRTPSVHASEPRLILGMELITDNFVVFEVLTLDFEEAMANVNSPIPTRSLMYDHATGRMVEPYFVDDNWPLRPWSNNYHEVERPANTAVCKLSPLRLVEAHKKGELSGSLAEIAAGLKEDDNPVVMIVKFK